MKYEMVKYNCDGCMFGVLDKDGNLLQKSWTIASSCQSLAKLQQYKRTKDHQHGQSRGAALKRAESYTYEMTDLIHECFSEFADSMKQFVTDSSAQNNKTCTCCSKASLTGSRYGCLQPRGVFGG